MSRIPVIGVVFDASCYAGRKTCRGVIQYARLSGWRIGMDFLYGRSAIHWDPSHYDGLISATRERAYFEHFKEHYSCFVNTQNSLPDDSTPTVIVDDEGIGEMGAEHLLERGFNRLAFFCVEQERYARLRKQSFQNAVHKAGLEPITLEPVRDDRQEVLHQETYDKITTWLKSRSEPTGIMTANDFGAQYIIGLCREAAIRVPEQIAVLGVDNDDLVTESLIPPASSVDPDFERVGFVAAQMLHDILDTGKPRRMQTLIQPKNVYTRESTDIIAVDDPVLARAVQWIRENACKGSNVKMLIADMDVSRRWLEVHYKKHFGISLHQAIMRERYRQAVKYLLESKLSITEIAERSGFGSLQHFNRSFSKHFDCSPAQFRVQIFI